MRGRDVFIIDGLRTPIGALGKGLKTLQASDLAAAVIKKLIEKNGISKNVIDEGILGNAVNAGLGQNPARQALIRAGLLAHTPAFTVEKVCGSGLKSVILAAQAIQCEDANIVIAGGTESVSNCPYLVEREKQRNANALDTMRDSLITDGLWCSLVDTHMGEIAEYTAEEFKIPREKQDAYALESHKKACLALENGSFNDEIVPIELGNGNFFTIDEKPRKNTSMEKLARIPSAFKSGGTITAGNSPQPADGAAVLLLASEEALKDSKIRPRARIMGYANFATDPKLVFTASGKAIEKCLKASSLKKSDIDLFEVNESFAVQAILTIKDLDLDKKRVNIHGGAIALGHPLGASGARNLVTLINSLEIEKKRIGLTTICLGGGCAVALAIEIV